MILNLPTTKESFRLLLISDTHVYKSSMTIPRIFTDRFRKCAPDHIIHCGDICRKSVLNELRQIAPVSAVRGNRDIFSFFSLPGKIDINVQGYRIHVEHGQGNLWDYLKIKTYTVLCKIRRKPYDIAKLNKLGADPGQFDILFFGHSHFKRIERDNNLLLVNPGHINLSGPFKPDLPPSFCFFRFEEAAIELTVYTLAGKEFEQEIYRFDKSKLRGFRENE